MSDNTPVKQSPIYSQALKMGARFTEEAGWQVPSLFSISETELAAAQKDVALADVSDRGKIYVEGKTADSIFPQALTIGEGVHEDGRYVYRLRQDLFFVSTTAEAVERVTAELSAAAQEAAGLITVTDMTHGESQLLVIGPKAAELLSRLCGLDFHNSQFPDLAARQSSVAKTRQLILRHDFGGVAVYALIGARSLADYLWKTTLEAGQDLSILPIGQASIDRLK